MRVRRFTPVQRSEIRQLLGRARALLFCAPDDLVEQIHEILEPAPASVRELAAMVREAERIAAAYKPPARRRTPFQENVWLLSEKGLTPKQIAEDIGTSANSVRKTLCNLRKLDRAA